MFHGCPQPFRGIDRQPHEICVVRRYRMISRYPLGSHGVDNPRGGYVVIDMRSMMEVSKVDAGTEHDRVVKGGAFAGHQFVDQFAVEDVSKFKEAPLPIQS